MGRLLSRISDENAASTIASATRGLEIRLAGERPDGDTIAYLYLKRALAQYQLEQPTDEVRSGLLAAASWRARVLKADGWSQLLQHIGLISAFGTAEDRVRCAALRDARVESYGDDDVLGPLLVRAWLARLRGESVDLGELLARCPEEDEAWEREWVFGLALCFQEVTLERGLSEVLRFHARQALEGDWKFRSEGLLSLPALGMCKLARECGIGLQVASPYCPLDLLP